MERRQFYERKPRSILSQLVSNYRTESREKPVEIQLVVKTELRLVYNSQRYTVLSQSVSQVKDQSVSFLLQKKYSKQMHQTFVSISKINELVFNQQTHLAAEFKEHLIYDDLQQDFLAAYYSHEQSTQRLRHLSRQIWKGEVGIRMHPSYWSCQRSVLKVVHHFHSGR